VDVLPAQVASSKALAHFNAASVSAEFEAYLPNPIEHLQVLHPQLFAVKQCPFLERRIFEQVAPVELQRGFVTAERQFPLAGFLPASGAQCDAKRFCIEPQGDVGMERESTLTMHHDRVLADDAQVASKSIQGDMEAVADNVGRGFGPEDATKSVAVH